MAKKGTLIEVVDRHEREAPRPGELLVVGAGYLLILVPGLYVSARKYQ